LNLPLNQGDSCMHTILSIISKVYALAMKIGTTGLIVVTLDVGIGFGIAIDRKVKNFFKSPTLISIAIPMPRNIFYQQHAGTA
jgi:hypothetical protein